MSRDDDHSTVLERRGESTPFDRHVSVVLTHRDGVEVIALPSGQSVIIGRSEPADLRYRCDRLSRRHARLRRDGESVTIEDLGSTNGTFLRGERIQGICRLRADDEVAMGSVRLKLHVMTAWEARLHGVDHHERFERELEEEVERARTFRRPLALILLRAPVPEALDRWVVEVRQALRTVDRVGLYGPSTLEILLPEADAEVAHQIAAQILGRRRGQARRCGIAIYPQAASAQALISHAMAALRRTTDAEPVRLHQAAATEPSAQGPLLHDPRMLRLYGVVDRLAPARVPVLILGETGTGKELVARALHGRSGRRGPLRTLNCGAIPEQLLESALFGHEKGAFTGADARRKGIFEQAQGGTVFLDEVGELSPAAQVALLRVLENQTISRVGGHEEIPVNARVVAATHRDLMAMCEEGTFRLDLFYRLEAMTLRIPPLRERPSEIVRLAERFLEEAVQASGRGVGEISPVAMAALELYPWPGNVRELRNIIERAVWVCDGDRIGLEDLPERVQDARRLNRPRTPEPTARIEPAAAAPRPEPMLLRPILLACESALIRSALRSAGENQSEAARLLHMPRRTLIYKLRALEKSEDAARAQRDAKILKRWSEPADEGLDFRSRIERIEERVLREAIDRLGPGTEALAAAVGLHPRTLASKVRKYQLLA